MEQKTITVSPFATNLLDLVGIPLKTKLGNKVRIKQTSNRFKVYVDDTLVFENDDNIQTSCFLNDLEIYYA